ncbi:uncharacterized protein LOC144867269 [Branchiostoma floridae x Branchiostoma japonicum]
MVTVPSHALITKVTFHATPCCYGVVTTHHSAPARCSEQTCFTGESVTDMATLVRGATRWLSSALHLGGAPGRKFSNALREERAAVFNLLEAYNDHVEAVSPYTGATVRLMPAVQKTVPQIGYSIETLLMQEAMSGISSLNISSKPSAWEVEQQARPKKFFAVRDGKATLVEED